MINVNGEEIVFCLSFDFNLVIHSNCIEDLFFLVSSSCCELERTPICQICFHHLLDEWFPQHAIHISPRFKFPILILSNPIFLRRKQAVCSILFTLLFTPKYWGEKEYATCTHLILRGIWWNVLLKFYFYFQLSFHLWNVFSREKIEWWKWIP